MHRKLLFVFASAALSISGCSTTEIVPSAIDSGTISPSDAGDAAVQPTSELGKLGGYLKGDFDNSAQVKGGFSKLVERHVCAIPGRPTGPNELHLYVEQVEVKPEGRDAYYTRVVVLTPEGANVITKIYKLAPSHPLSSDAFKYNGPRDGCLAPSVLASIKESDLLYREGCDVTFVPEGNDRYTASTTGTACSFPGGYIETTADVFSDGLDAQDKVVSGGQKTGDTFKFRRVLDFKPAPPPRDAAAD